MKNIKILNQKYAVVVIFYLIFFPVLSTAQYTLQDDDVVVENGMIVSCDTDTSDWGESDIIVPNYLDDQEIIGIANTYLGVFNDKGITSVVLPNTFKFIGYRAFAMNDIVKFTIPNSVIYLGRNLFAAMNTLDTVVFEPNSNIRIISKDAFFVGSCSGCLAPVTFPDNVNGGFSNYVDTSGTTYEAGVTINNLRKAYYANLTPYELTLNDVEFSDGVISGIYNLYPKIIIPAILDGVSVHSIGNWVFDDYSILSVQLPVSLKHLGDNALSNNNLSEIEFLDNIETIGAGAFANNALSIVTIPNNLNSIGESAFINNKLSCITNPENLKYIGASAFNCNKIIEVNHNPSNGLIFGRNDNGTLDSTTIVSYGGISDTIDFIPDVVTALGKGAFKNVFDNTWNIKYVNLLNNIRYIGRTAFYGNELDTIVIPKNIERIDDHAFSSCSLDSVIFQNNSNLVYVGYGVFSQNYNLSSLSLPTPVLKEGYDEFLGWYENDVKIEMPITNLWSGDYEARFHATEYNIYYENVGTLNNSSNPSYYNIEHYVYLKSPYDSVGYTFSGWFLDESFNDPVRYPVIEAGTTGDTTFYAKWDKVDVTSIRSNENPNILIYPNPIKDMLFIKSDQLYLISIFDIDGREVLRRKMQSLRESIDLSTLKAGIYILKLSNSHRFVIKKVLKY